jgi:chromosomal replication initiator protein
MFHTMTTLIDNQTLWESCRDCIKSDLSEANYNTWFKDAFLIKVDDGVAVIGVPNTFIKEWLINKFNSLILKALRDKENTIKSVSFTVAKIDRQEKETKKERVVKENNTSIPVTDLLISKDSQLNPRYTFENFVVGPFNELAFAASQAILKQPGVIYNPLFIHGNTGHGKTHLIQAIGNHLKSISENMKVFYLTSEKFYSDFLGAVQNNKVALFKEKYRKYDVLIMDDIQFLSKKEKTQEELFHLFNYLYENNKQIIFSSDKHPHFIPNLEDRLKSRFSQGMIVDIPSPDHESRTEIIRKKSAMSGLFLDDNIIDYLAGNIDGNIREIEGIINLLACHIKVKNRNITTNDIKELLKNSSKPKKMISVQELVKIVSEFYGISSENLIDKTRRKEVVKPRQITMYILREDFNISFPTIGEKMGGRDHTTVIHSCEKIKQALKDDKQLEQQIEEIRTIIQ